MSGRVFRASSVALLCGAFCLAQAQVAQQRTRRQPRRGQPAPSAQESKAVEPLLEAGDRLAAQKKYAEAADAYRLAVRVNPQSAAAHIRLGDALMDAGRWDEARVAYRQAAVVAPSSADAHYALGQAFNDMGQHGDAFAPLVKAVQLDPSFAEAHYGIAHAYLMTDQPDKSLSYFQSALRLSPDYEEARFGLALARLRLRDRAGFEEERARLTDASLLKRLEQEARTADRDTAAAAKPAQAQTTASASRTTPTPSDPESRLIDVLRGRGNLDAPAPKGNGRAAETATRTNARQPGAAPSGAVRGKSDKSADFELAFWDTIKDSKDPEDFRAYLRKYPDGEFVELAARRAAAGDAGRPSSAAPPAAVQPSATQPAARPAAPSPAAPKTTAGASTPPATGAASSPSVLASDLGIQPGVSTRADVERLLGPPVRAVNQTMNEYAARPGVKKVYVEFPADAEVVSQLVLNYASPVPRAAMLRQLGLPERATTRKPNSKGKLVELFESPKMLGLTYATADDTGGVTSLSYYSPRAFDRLAGREEAKRKAAEQQKAAAPKAAEKPAAKPAQQPAAPAGPSYAELVQQAQGAWASRDNASAVRLLQRAVSMDAAQAPAFQLLGIVQLYGANDVGAAAGSMRAAIDRGGAASFGVTHDHDGFFKTYCQGSLHVSRAGVAFQSNDGRHVFQVADAQVKEFGMNGFVGANFGGFHLKVVQPDGKTKNYNFAPGTNSAAESQLILSLINY